MKRYKAKFDSISLYSLVEYPEIGYTLEGVKLGDPVYIENYPSVKAAYDSKPEFCRVYIQDDPTSKVVAIIHKSFDRRYYEIDHSQFEDKLEGLLNDE